MRGLPGFLRTLRDEPTYLGLVWREGGVTFQVGSQNLTDAELVEIVARMRPATSDEWREAVESSPNRPSPRPAPTSTVISTVPG